MEMDLPALDKVRQNNTPQSLGCNEHPFKNFGWMQAKIDGYPLHYLQNLQNFAPQSS